MASDYRIRIATAADVAALAEIERRCFSDPWSPAGILETVQNETSLALVAGTEAATVGYLMGRVSGEEGEILNLAVLPEHRRAGIGADLLERGLQLLAARGVREVYLEVRASNEPALELYRARGFRPVGVRSHYYRNPREDALVLRAPISAPR